jgi:hypothetical protein
LIKNFRSVEYSPLSASLVPGVPHPIERQRRNAADALVSTIIRLSGFRRYDWFMSRRNQVAKMRGYRPRNYPHDANCVYQKDTIHGDDIVTMIDVDWHVDMPAHLASHPKAHLIYTIVPSDVGGVIPGGSSFCFTGDEWTQFTEGTQSYHHRLWDYSADVFPVGSWVPGRYRCWKVYTRRLSSQRALILLVPYGNIYHFCGPLEWPRLSRIAVAHGRYSFVRFYDNGSCWYSLGLSGNPSSVRLTPQQYEYCVTAQPKALTHFSLKQTWKESFDSEIQEEHCNLIVMFFAERSDYAPRSLTQPTIMAETPVSNVAKQSDVEDKALVREYMAPLVIRDQLAFNSREAKLNSIEKRVTSIRVLKERGVPESFVDAFLRFLFDNKRHFLAPASFNDLVDEATLAQKHRLATAAAGPFSSSTKVRGFLKSEPVGVGKPPRLIVNFGPTDNLAMARWIYPLERIVKHHTWYAFGKNPPEIAECVSTLALKHDFLCVTDFSSFDGRVGAAWRRIEETILFTAFAPRYHKEILASHRRMMDRTVYLDDLVHYELGYSRGSGERGTSLFNTLFNVFISFVASLHNGTGPEMLGIYGGDDGLSPVPAKHLEAVSAAFGQKLKCEVIHRNEPGVSFLSRMYTESVWQGDPSSIADIPKTLSRLHLTHAPQHVDPVLIFYRRMQGWLQHDALTPFIGELAETVCNKVESFGCFDRGKDEFGLRGFWSRDLDDAKSWPNCAYDYYHIEPDLMSVVSSFTETHSLDDIRTLIRNLACYERPVSKKVDSDGKGKGKTANPVEIVKGPVQEIVDKVLDAVDDAIAISALDSGNKTQQLAVSGADPRPVNTGGRPPKEGGHNVDVKRPREDRPRVIRLRFWRQDEQGDWEHAQEEVVASDLCLVAREPKCVTAVASAAPKNNPKNKHKTIKIDSVNVRQKQQKWQKRKNQKSERKGKQEGSSGSGQGPTPQNGGPAPTDSSVGAKSGSH